LLYPPDDERFAGSETTVMLQWTSVGILSEDEWYAVHLRYLGERAGDLPNQVVEYTHVTSWRVPEAWYPGGGDVPERFEWKIEVVRNPGDGAPPEVISSSGFVRHFSWQ
jgi:hypothetical protein